MRRSRCTLKRDRPGYCCTQDAIQPTAVDACVADDTASHATGRQQNSGVLHCRQRADRTEQSLRVLDSSLAGFKRTLKTHLFTLDDWRCCDFTVIVAPDTIDFTDLLTAGKHKHGGPHLMSLFCDTKAFVLKVLDEFFRTITIRFRG